MQIQRRGDRLGPHPDLLQLDKKAGCLLFLRRLSLPAPFFVFPPSLFSPVYSVPADNLNVFVGPIEKREVGGGFGRVTTLVARCSRFFPQ